MHREMSAKDKAFEKERVQFRQTLRQYERELRNKDVLISELQIDINNKEDRIREQEKRISELLELINRPADEIEYLLGQRDVVTALDGLHVAVSSMGRRFLSIEEL